ncbi:hypothetical protein ZIOFF_068880 [Zingiber officinale]|uniref:Protein kinase domain-containing protein n=1 Tax=Zingiber officinale TaxID=94328 RepID=A0A8J5C583_ZINOF|nr:hypothetical protein ZIOFF_068880 [Zingiber officinale]
MSRFMISDLDMGMGCCGCLGFFKKPERDVDFEKFRILDRDRFRKVATLTPGKDRAICRGMPVKETKLLTLSQDDFGQKMINEFARIRTIGRGSYGKVILYQNTIDGKQYAFKVIVKKIFPVQVFYKSRLSRVQVTSTETAMTDVLREVLIMKTIEHPNIINLIEVIDDPDSVNLYLVLEYVEGQQVCASSGTFGGIGEDTARRYLRDIVSGLMYLHEHDIVHGDIKPDNLLVTREGSLKIGDFSVSHIFEDGNDELCRSPGTPVFTAPECCLGSSFHGKVADIWAVGVTLHCMILGYCPFIGDTLQDTYDKIVHSPLDLPSEIDPDLQNLLGGLLCKDPSQRMTLDEVANHSWVIRDCEPLSRTPCRCKSVSLDKEIKAR